MSQLGNRVLVEKMERGENIDDEDIEFLSKAGDRAFVWDSDKFFKNYVKHRNARMLKFVTFSIPRTAEEILKITDCMLLPENFDTHYIALTTLLNHGIFVETDINFHRLTKHPFTQLGT